MKFEVNATNDGTIELEVKWRKYPAIQKVSNFFQVVIPIVRRCCCYVKTNILDVISPLETKKAMKNKTLKKKKVKNKKF